MAETANIAKMAEKLSNEVFSKFFWQATGPINQNWACENKDFHGVGTHPADIVFFYDEPYSCTRTYVHCDLKSYAKGTIKKSAVHGAIESLANQVACAEKSESWQKLYMHDNVTPSVCGLLFVYNHDGEYDHDFMSLCQSVKHEQLDLPRNGKIFVLGPQDIFWLDCIADDIDRMRGNSELPPPDKCHYFYPQLVRKTNVQTKKAKAATLEMLTAPWIILEYDKEYGRRGIVVFYKRKGEKIHEFMYLIDYLRHYQVLNDNTDILIKTIDTIANASVVFEKAVQAYIEDIDEGDGDSNFAQLVRKISYKKMTKIKTTFSEIDLGMDYA